MLGDSFRKFLGFIGWPVLCGLVFAVFYLQQQQLNHLQQQLQQPYQAESSNSLAASGLTTHSYADAVMAAVPSVVNIYSLKRVQQRSLFDDPFFQRFFHFRHAFFPV